MPPTSTSVRPPGPVGESGTYRLDEQVGFLLRLAYQRASANLAARLAADELTTVQWAALVRLHEDGPLSQNELGRRIGMEKGNVHGLVRRLTERGLVRRDSPGGTDRRRHHLALTGAGVALVERLLPRAEESNEQTLSRLGGPERAALRDLLKRLG